MDEQERFKYFLATVVAWSIIALVLIFSSVSFSINALVSAAVNLSVALLGIFWCYRVNKSGDNADFIPRLICLGWPVGIWGVVILSSVVLIELAAFIPLEMSKMPDSPSPLSAMANMLRRLWPGIGSALGNATPGFCLVFYCSIISRYVSVAAKAKGTEESTQSWKRPMTDEQIVLSILGIIGALIVGMLGSSYIRIHVGLPALADLLTYLAVGLWILLISIVWGLIFKRRQSTKEAQDRGSRP